MTMRPKRGTEQKKQPTKTEGTSNSKRRKLTADVSADRTPDGAGKKLNPRGSEEPETSMNMRNEADDDSTGVVGITPDDSTKDADHLPPDGNKEIETTNIKMPVKMILDDVERFSHLLQCNCEKSSKTPAVSPLWANCPPVSTVAVSDSYKKFWEEEFLTDLTLLAGPRRVPIKVHKLVLAVHFEYFKSMFSCGLQESTTSGEIHLPSVGPEDLRLLLSYAYSGEANLTKENVFKMLFMSNYFISDDLLNRCNNFIRKYISLNNCVKLFEVVSDLGINQLRENCFLFIVYHLPEINKDDLSALPVELLLEIFQHPAAVMVDDNPAESEKRMFKLLWNRVKRFSKQKKDEFTVKILKAIHLPVTGRDFLSFLQRKVGRIQEARELIANAGDERIVSETREWYLPRVRNVAVVRLFKCGKPTGMDGLKCDKPINVNGTRSAQYSQCVLIKGFPFFIYTSPSDEYGGFYRVESPWAIEHLGLPCKVVLEVKEYVGRWEVNRYHKGISNKNPINNLFDLSKRDIEMRVKLE